MPEIKYPLILLTLLICCSACSSKATVNDDKISQNSESTPDTSYISVDVNDRFLFEFEQAGGEEWSGMVTQFTTTEKGEKVVQGRFRSANDSTWTDFGMFVDYLKLFELPDQQRLNGKNPETTPHTLRYDFTLRQNGEERSITYVDPVQDLRKYWESQNIYTFITYMENDLKWIPMPMESPGKDR